MLPFSGFTEEQSIALIAVICQLTISYLTLDDKLSRIEEYCKKRVLQAWNDDDDDAEDVAHLVSHVFGDDKDNKHDDLPRQNNKKRNSFITMMIICQQ